ncbi:MAG: hypothetical protein JNK00_04670 [Flavipsychrobacter sp.]|nr:hypothetical protein [Flavipsychrobacter sp.]
MKSNFPSNTFFRSIEFSKGNRYGVAASLYGDIYQTSDSGESWIDISANVPDTGLNKNRICGLTHADTIFYGVGWWGGTVARLYKSSDNGLNWVVDYIDTSLATGLVDIMSINDSVFLASGTRQVGGLPRESVVLKSTDRCKTWKKVFSDTAIGGRIWKLQFLNDQIGYGSIEQYYFYDSIAYIQTKDGGDTWNIHGIGSVVLTGSLRKSAQGIGFINEQFGYVGGMFNGQFGTTDSGKTWLHNFFGNNYNRFFVIDSNLMYASGDVIYQLKLQDNSTIKKTTTNRGESRVVLHPVYPNPSSGVITIEFDLSFPENVLLEVVNLDTRTVNRVAAGYFKKGHHKYVWDGQGATKGNYIVWLGTDTGPFVQKFTLLK